MSATDETDLEHELLYTRLIRDLGLDGEEADALLGDLSPREKVQALELAKKAADILAEARRSTRH